MIDRRTFTGEPIAPSHDDAFSAAPASDDPSEMWVGDDACAPGPVDSAKGLPIAERRSRHEICWRDIQWVEPTFEEGAAALAALREEERARVPPAPAAPASDTPPWRGSLERLLPEQSRPQYLVRPATPLEPAPTSVAEEDPPATGSGLDASPVLPPSPPSTLGGSAATDEPALAALDPVEKSAEVEPTPAEVIPSPATKPKHVGEETAPTVAAAVKSEPSAATSETLGAAATNAAPSPFLPAALEISASVETTPLAEIGAPAKPVSDIAQPPLASPTAVPAAAVPAAKAEPATTANAGAAAVSVPPLGKATLWLANGAAALARAIGSASTRVRSRIGRIGPASAHINRVVGQLRRFSPNWPRLGLGAAALAMVALAVFIDQRNDLLRGGISGGNVQESQIQRGQARATQTQEMEAQGTEATKTEARAAKSTAPQSTAPAPSQQSEPSGPPNDPAQRAAYYLGRAKAGDPAAQYNVAVLYARGDGLTQDFANALSWFRQAAINGSVAAQFNLGVLYERGLGTPQNMSEAIVWYRAAADRNYAPAQYNLALAYSEAHGTPIDWVAAARWYHRAAEQGLVPAMINLAILYEKGDGVARSLPDAYAWYRAAGERGDPAGAKRAGELFGQFPDADRKRAESLFTDTVATIRPVQTEPLAPSRPAATSGAAQPPVLKTGGGAPYYRG